MPVCSLLSAAPWTPWVVCDMGRPKEAVNMVCDVDMRRSSKGTAHPAVPWKRTLPTLSNETILDMRKPQHGESTAKNEISAVDIQAYKEKEQYRCV